MKRKGSKKIIHWAILCLVLFLVGFLTVKMFALPQMDVSDGSDDATAQRSISDNDEPTPEKREVNYTATIIIFLLIVAVLAYGYHKEKKRNL
jgi:cytoskeletal protein RodZ